MAHRKEALAKKTCQTYSLATREERVVQAPAPWPSRGRHGLRSPSQNCTYRTHCDSQQPNVNTSAKTTHYCPATLCSSWQNMATWESALGQPHRTSEALTTPIAWRYHGAWGGVCSSASHPEYPLLSFFTPTTPYSTSIAHYSCDTTLLGPPSVPGA